MQEQKDNSGLIAAIIGVGIVGITAFLFMFGAPKDTGEINLPYAYEPTNNIISTTNYLHDKKINIRSQKKFFYKYDYTLNVEGKVINTVLRIPLPKDDIIKQKITNKVFKPTPTRIYQNGSNYIAEYFFDELTAGKHNISIEGKAHVNTYEINQAKKFNRNYEKEQDLSKYLAEEDYIEPNHPITKKVANSIQGNTREEIVKNINSFIQNNFEYTRNINDIKASEALRLKKGKCIEFSNVMVSLCRAKNIPSRVVTGNINKPGNEKHTWVEVYYDNYGWVTYDPTILYLRKFSAFQKKTDLSKMKLVSKKRINTAGYYISSIRNSFYSYYLSYELEHTEYTGKLSIEEKITLKETK